MRLFKKQKIKKNGESMIVASGLKSISFKETYEKCNLPVITLYNDTYPLNFIIDSGASICVINKSVLKYLHYTEVKDKNVSVMTASEDVEGEAVKIQINDETNIEEVTFLVMNLDGQFKSISEQDGVIIHGILGNNFLEHKSALLNYSSFEISW